MTAIVPQLKTVRRCSICAEHLPLGARPIFQYHPQARILIVSQAPGRKAHESGIPFADASGERLRQWMGVSSKIFYTPHNIAIVPMGFCFPGTGKSGDLPPRPECAPAWREKLVGHLTSLELTLVIGQYAQAYYFPDSDKSVTKTVKEWNRCWPHLVPLPHPSPRNNIWLRKNPWFENELVPRLQARVAEILPHAS
ncbi:Uracil-DNA glycosylase [Desulfuromusa kysingii]|uniref:Uracil-DNA glycosylase n=1 Tax=Desulfuromusa kysingii TaxID=37625 RepID=A0A1H3ZV30_9BACT|nr:uracil-DNA glycosylase family protein [Desulfuromusa kysingii]SEA27509.1 Uracil-DNA glycosylase [Desulfuromusa kysingii]